VLVDVDVGLIGGSPMLRTVSVPAERRRRRQEEAQLRRGERGKHGAQREPGQIRALRPTPKGQLVANESESSQAALSGRGW
jgi:hypothetical protein